MNTEKQYIYIWEYIIKNENRGIFEGYYKSEGKWHLFYSKSDGFIKCELLKDSLNQQRYIALDYWKLKSSKNDIILKYSDEYKKIDSECSELTERNRFMGEFEYK